MFRPVHTPTILLWGREDSYARRVSVDAAAAYMTGPYRLIELDAGHWLEQEQPDGSHTPWRSICERTQWDDKPEPLVGSLAHAFCRAYRSALEQLRPDGVEGPSLPNEEPSWLGGRFGSDDGDGVRVAHRVTG